MKLNNSIQCDGYTPVGKDGVTFTLSGTTVAAAAALEPPYIITDDGGETVADYTGFDCTGVWTFGESSVQLRAARELSTEAREAIRAVEGNLDALTAKATAIEGDVSDVEEANSDVLQAIGELGVDIAGIQSTNADLLQAVGELGTMIASLSAPADDVTE